jgi:hypothetical protein
MPPVGFEPAISAGDRPLGPALGTLRLENMSVHLWLMCLNTKPYVI